MKRVFVVAILLAVGSLAIVGVVYGANKYLSAVSAKVSSVVRCDAALTTHDVSIHGSVVSPNPIEAKLCDKLVITNEDERLRLIAFGAHNNHQSYDGVTERVLSRDQSVTVILNQRGTYKFHDHLEDSVIGYFTVTD